MSRVTMCHAMHTNGSCMSHVTHLNESCHTYEWVMSHVRMSHARAHSHVQDVTYIRVCVRGRGKERGQESELWGVQVFNCVLAPEKTGWLRKASLYSVFPVNRHLWYQAMGAASNHGNALKEKMTGNSKIQQKQQMMAFVLDISVWGGYDLVGSLKL